MTKTVTPALPSSGGSYLRGADGALTKPATPAKEQPAAPEKPPVKEA